MPTTLEIQRNRLRRLRVLQRLYEARPDYLGEGILLQLISADRDLAPTRELLRESLDYLAQRGYATLHSDDRIWCARISADGIDFLESRESRIDGIAHPSEFIR